MTDDSDNPWESAAPARITLANVLPALQRHRGIPPAEAAAFLRPALESYRIMNEVVGWRGGTEGPVALKIEALRHRYYVSPRGWAEVDWKAGTIRGHTIRVWWSHVLRALAPRGAVPSSGPAPSPCSTQKSEATTRTGVAGRPTSKHLFQEELARRAEVGKLAATVTEEASALLAWMRTSHRNLPPPTLKTIRNTIAKPFRDAKLALATPKTAPKI